MVKQKRYKPKDSVFPRDESVAFWLEWRFANTEGRRKKIQTLVPIIRRAFEYKDKDTDYIIAGLLNSYFEDLERTLRGKKNV